MALDNKPLTELMVAKFTDINAKLDLNEWSSIPSQSNVGHINQFPTIFYFKKCFVTLFHAAASFPFQYFGNNLLTLFIHMFITMQNVFNYWHFRYFALIFCRCIAWNWICLINIYFLYVIIPVKHGLSSYSLNMHLQIF